MGNNNELKGLSRKELLEILLEQTKRIEDLEILLEDSKKKIESKRISLEQTGSLAEAALKLSDIFKSADDAIAIYKLNIEESVKKEEKKFKKECREIKNKIIADTEEKCLKKLEQTSRECEKKEEETKDKCKKIEEESAKRVKDLEKQIKSLERKLSNEKVLKGKIEKPEVSKVKDTKKENTKVASTSKTSTKKRKFK